MDIITEKDPEIIRLKNFINPGIKFGSTLILCFGVFYLIWGGLAPIDSAVIAHGTIISSGNKQVVQHLHGGTLSKILINDGDFVEKGQVLYELSRTQAHAKLQSVHNQYLSKRLAESRIIAEREGEDHFDIPEEVRNATLVPEVEKILASETNVFHFNNQTWKGQRELLQQQLLLADDHLKGLASQRNSANEQLKLVHEELANVQILYDKKLVQKPRLLNLKKNSVELEGRIAEIDTNTNKTKESMNETKMKIEQLSYNRKRELSAELKEVQQHIASLKQELTSAQDIETRTKITSPVAGIATGTKFHTLEGVVPPGATLLEIVPTNNTLIVEAKLNPQDIDVVSVGQSAKIMITAFKARFTPRISGRLTYVSADKHMDERSGQPYYLVRAAINYDEVKNIGKTILPGMMAEVFIVTGEHTFLQYFLSPITNSLRKSFREK